MTIQAQLPDGRVLEFPDGTDPQVIQSAVKKLLLQQQGLPQQGQSAPIQPAPAAPRELTGFPGSGFIEPALSVGSAIAAEPIAGLAGIGRALTGDPVAAGQTVEDVQQALTFQPRTEKGQESLRALGEFVEPVGDLFKELEQSIGQIALPGPGNQAAVATLRASGQGLLADLLEKGASPELATALFAGPTTAAEIAGARGGLAAGAKARRIAKADLPADINELVKVGEARRVPLLTSDVIPPETFLGKSIQQLGEKLGPLGTGGKRAAQQRARVDVVTELADEFGVDITATFESDIIKSVVASNARKLQEAGVKRNAAVTKLDEFGEVPTAKTISEIDRQIAKQVRLGAKGDQSLVDSLNATRDSLSGGDFSLVKDVRQEVISDLLALQRSDDARAAGSIQAVKSAIDKDMVAFARANDKAAARDWLASNRRFAHELGKAKNTELKRILLKGEATPEVVGSVLKGGKISELQRLRSSMGAKGTKAAQSAIIRNAMQDAGFFSGDPNPNRLATSLAKPNIQKAINVFFDDAAKKELKGMQKLLDKTRRAQDAAVSTPTGQQLIPFALGGGAVADPLTTALIGGSVSAVTKARESKAFRNLILKLANAPSGSKREKQIINGLAPFVASIQVPEQKDEQ